jgi:hypothetical protein
MVLYFPILVGDTVMEINFRASKKAGGKHGEGIGLFAYYVCNFIF